MGGILPGPIRAKLQARQEQIIGTTRLLMRIPRYENCTAPACGYDQVSDAAINPNCVVCEGKGRITTWHFALTHGRVAWIDAQRFNVFQGLPTGPVGDVDIQARMNDEALFQAVMDEPRAYIELDGKKLRPIAIIHNRIESENSLDVRCIVANV